MPRRLMRGNIALRLQSRRHFTFSPADPQNIIGLLVIVAVNMSIADRIALKSPYVIGLIANHSVRPDGNAMKFVVVL